MSVQANNNRLGLKLSEKLANILNFKLRKYELSKIQYRFIKSWGQRKHILTKNDEQIETTRFLTKQYGFFIEHWRNLIEQI